MDRPRIRGESMDRSRIRGERMKRRIGEESMKTLRIGGGRMDISRIRGERMKRSRIGEKGWMEERRMLY